MNIHVVSLLFLAVALLAFAVYQALRRPKPVPLFENIYGWFRSSIPASADSVYRKVLEEMGEFLANPSDHEAADVAICLVIWLRCNGIRLEDLMLAKHRVNTGRRWEWRPGEGVWHHVD